MGIGEFDKDGNMANWWTDADAAAFKERTDVLVKQFNQIVILPAKDGQPALMADGALSLGKNRVNATLRNIQTFYDAFGITDGAMFLPEEERVVIW